MKNETKIKALIASGIVLVGGITTGILLKKDSGDGIIIADPEVVETPNVEPTAKPTPTMEPTQTPEPSVPVETDKPVETKPVNPDKPVVTPVDHSKEVQAEAKKLLDSALTNINSINADKGNVKTQIESMNKKYKELEDNYNIISSLLADADQLIASSDSSIKTKLQEYRSQIKAELDKVQTKMTTISDEISNIQSKNNEIDTTSLTTKHNTLLGNVSKLKNSNELGSYTEILNSTESLLKEASDLKLAASTKAEKVSKETANSNVNDSIGYLKNMNNVVIEYEKNKVRPSVGGGTGGSHYEPTPVPEDTRTDVIPDPVINDVDDQIITSEEAPLPEPSNDEDVVVMSLGQKSL